MKWILSIDQSTSSTKAVLFDAVGRVIDHASRDHRQIYPQPGWVEHDAEEIWQNVLAAIREIAARNSGLADHLAGLSITNQRETILVFDRATGRPLHNVIVWQCRRGDSICSELNQQGHGDLVRRKTGLKIDSYFSASKLKWLMAEKPAIAAKLRSREAVIGTMDAYLIHRLTQGRVFATDVTNASRTLLYDISRLKWDDELGRLFDVPLHALPEVRESSAQFGDTDAAGILPRRVPICGVMGDSQASLFAQSCGRAGTAKATFGTGTSVLLNIDEKFHLPGEDTMLALAGVWKGKPVYALEGIISFSAASIAWLKNQIGLIQSAAEAEKLATAVEDNGGVYLVPAFTGLSAPHWAPDARAAIVGLSTFTRREHIVRAAEEAIAYQIRDVLDMMKADAHGPIANLCADGGPTRDAFLMQFTADITGVDLKVANIAESSAWGAAMNGLLGLGLCPSLDGLAALPRETRDYRPQMAPAKVRQLHDGWLAAVKRVL